MRQCQYADAVKTRNLILTVLVVFAGLTSGCSFSREWKSASRQPATPRDLTGAWVGTWQNSNNSHHDQLKAVITRVSETEYHARFKAWWLGIISGTFDVTLAGEWAGDEFHFRGNQDVMGWEIAQTGWLTSTQFNSKYSSMDYRGTFTLERPPAAK